MSLWLIGYLYCHKRITPTYPRATDGARKKVNFPKFSSATKQLEQQQFCSFQGGGWGWHSPGNMSLVTTMWVPMGSQVLVLSPNDHPNPSQGRQIGFEKFYCLQLALFQPVQLQSKFPISWPLRKTIQPM